jgi:hypothetical protein
MEAVSTSETLVISIRLQGMATHKTVTFIPAVRMWNVRKLYFLLSSVGKMAMVWTPRVQFPVEAGLLSSTVFRLLPLRGFRRLLHKG